MWYVAWVCAVCVLCVWWYYKLIFIIIGLNLKPLERQKQASPLMPLQNEDS